MSLTLFEGGGLTRGDLQLDSWDMLFDSDPVVSGITAVTKNPLVSQHSHTSNFVVQQVPEPATAALFALGLGGLALVGRRRS